MLCSTLLMVLAAIAAAAVVVIVVECNCRQLCHRQSG